MTTTYNNKELSLPFDEILLNNGYEIKREKSSKNSITMTNSNKDTIVISRTYNGHYLYFNPNDSIDRGNIYSFCKNRGIKLKDLLSNKINIKELKHNLSESKDINNDKILDDFKALNSLKNENFLVSKRLIDKEILSSFLHSMKEDNFHNVCIPTYTIKKIRDINTKILIQSGYMTYLKTPMKKDKDGVILKKAIKQICYGKKGLELLKSKDSKKSDIKNIIISESAIDSLSLLELKNLNPNETLLCSTNGTFTASHKEGLLYLKDEVKNVTFLLGFDSDEKGLIFSKEIKELLKENVEVLKPSLKDFNDDLIVSKFLRLNKSFSINELEKSLNSFTQKIKEYASKNKLKELKASLKILENIKDKSKNYISKESLANVDLALKTSISKGLSYER
ncbi:toprim domain-containing protein [Campylobacter avium]|uniref:toprim domain-containing protein n=1 Tax=Campylobacter avium TaxID=522485 RepID=UPI0023575223|nr:toprim domain-containing protein [Campylobacter avium]